MDDDTLSKIFDPFFTTKFTGRGLGLAAVLGIVRGHKGGLYVTSELDKGTVFELFFPAMEEADTAVATDTAVALNRQPISGAVLMIDDEASVREAAVDILALENVFVFTAANGADGIALYQEKMEAIDLILLDLSMPGLSGHETFRALRQIDPQVKIILSSGYSEEEVYRQFAGEDVTDFLAKPFQLATLIQKAQRYLG
jgi:CheY-like chemotaxis protein